MKTLLRRYFSIPKGREYIYDYIRVISCILVITVHASGTTQGLLGEFLRTISPPGMAIFVFLSGTLLLNDPRTEKIGSFYWRRFISVVVPFLLYELLFSCWIDRGGSIPGPITLDSFTEAIHMIPSAFLDNLRFPDNGHVWFWFIFMIIGLYLLAPWLRIGLKHLNERFAKGLVVLIFCIMAVESYLPIFGIDVEIYFWC